MDIAVAFTVNESCQATKESGRQQYRPRRKMPYQSMKMVKGGTDTVDVTLRSVPIAPI